MKTRQVISGEKRMVSLNMDRELYLKVKVFAAERDTTVTAILEHLLKQHLDHCKHDKIRT
jgi:hypothetical protein